MADVDFSNARIEPFGTICPAAYSYLNITTNSSLRDANDTSIASNHATRDINDQKQMLTTYYGTFTASGTEFYLYQYTNLGVGKWKISNVSFNSGDTYMFNINAELVCE